MPAIAISSAAGSWLLVAVLCAGVSLAAARATAAGEGGSEEAAPAVTGPAFVRLPLFNIPVIERDRVTRQVTVGIALELADGLRAESIDGKKPAVIDAFLRDLYGMFAQRGSASRIANQQSIKQRLTQTADRVLGPGTVRQVLVLQLL